MPSPVDTRRTAPRQAQLDPGVRSEFQKALFSQLLWDPLDWRARRTDRFVGTDIDTCNVATEIDFRVRRSTIAEVIAQTAQNSTDAALLKRECERGMPVILPLMWLDAPSMDFHLSVEGQCLVPLARREAAAFIASPYAAFLNYFGVDECMPGADDAGMLPGLCRCLVATDPRGHRLRAVARALRRPPNPKRLQDVTDWMDENRSRGGLLDAPARPDAGRMIYLWLRSRRLNQRYLSLTGVAPDTPAGALPLSALTCPILLHDTYLRLVENCEDQPDQFQAWDNSRGFLDFCLRVLEMMEWLVSSVEDEDEHAEFATEALRDLALLSERWPVLARIPVVPGQDCRVRLEYSVALRRRLSTVMGDYSLPFIVRIMWWAPRATAAAVWAYARLPFASLADYFGVKRLRPRTTVNTLALPIAFGDARGYHVEVSSDHASLALVPRSAYYEIPPKDFFFGWINRLVGWRWLRRQFPRGKVSPESVFGRVSDSAERLQHFYTTRPGPDRSVGVGPRYGSQASGRRLLYVRVAAPSFFVLTNWILAAGLAGVSYAVASGLIHPSPPEEGRWELLMTLAPWYLGTIVLYAVERQNAIIVRKLKWPAGVVLVSLTVFMLSVGLRWF